jgi:4-hydroxy-tetrahydrodipicolinate reductase
MIKLAISGCAGRMGSAVWALALQDPEFKVKVALEKPGHPLVGQEKNGLVVTDILTKIQVADVLIEFTTPEATIAHVGYAVTVKNMEAMVIGTTGLSEENKELLKSASEIVPILFSSNMSIGVNLLFGLVPEMAKKLGPGWDIEIVEAHRKAKADAPSGTAKDFVRFISEATKREVPTHALRMGDIAGDHTIIFAGQGERIEIVHRAQSPVLFAKGALNLAKKLIDRPAGLYEPVDLL